MSSRPCDLIYKTTGVASREFTLAQCQQVIADTGDVVRSTLGVDCTSTEIRELKDAQYYIGSFFNESGTCMMRLVAINEQQHWPTDGIASIVWEFFAQFSRDLETGGLIVNP